MTRHDTRRLRVVQWATGDVGLHSLRAYVGHSTLQLVGVPLHPAEYVVYAQDAQAEGGCA